jgi:hypothetical protein
MALWHPLRKTFAELNPNEGGFGVTLGPCWLVPPEGNSKEKVYASIKPTSKRVTLKFTVTLLTPPIFLLPVFWRWFSTAP